MKVPGLRSPHDKVGGLVYFARLLDKIRLHQRGELPAEFHANLGEFFDKLCVQHLGIAYAALVERVKQGGTDEEILAWSRENGRPLTEQDFHIWNEFIRKRGWNDAFVERLKQRKAESGFSSRDEIHTLFDYIDADEERPLRAQPWQ